MNYWIILGAVEPVLGLPCAMRWSALVSVAALQILLYLPRCLADTDIVNFNRLDRALAVKSVPKDL